LCQAVRWKHRRLPERQSRAAPLAAQKSEMAAVKSLQVPTAAGGAKRNRASVMQRVAEEDGALDSTATEDLLLQQAADVESQEGVPTIALVAHDNMKKLMRQFVQVHLEMLKAFKLTGTGTTCAMLRSEGLEPIGSTASGPLGGDQQIGAMIVRGEVSAVFFFRDPFSSHAHIADIEALSRLVDCYQCYYGSNYRSSSAVLSFMHGNLQRRAATGVRCSIMKPLGVEDLAETVQSDYKSTRAAALTKSSVEAAAK